ncbi:hypothetical protein A5718_07735 [Mycolicibacterium conceptionense]|nr:hypothetical protein AA982_01420 [Mycolicibacterium senegalense]OBB10695.1 hypothetical protein A5718_07735 [Mycolicibacterium conceptionense]OBF30609.1 hypothetical protein A5720_29640 [Mycolicibacterium conceptionense]OBH94956.1 hypothetical protein A5716_23340 [Mycolicibacterium conceptionense]OBK04630.1 hypothetical protein A5639_20315 [Mycolicibacterium conceptionense]
MSWLLVALIPGLLMLAAFGLERLESGLAREPAPAPLTPRVKPMTIDLDSERLPTRYYEPQAINTGFRASRPVNRV